MPRTLTQYLVFIGSPGDLDERTRFRSTLERYTTTDGEPRGVAFSPVGWEDTPSQAGRPQALINDDLMGSDYAIFVFHDRWGSPTGKYSAGTEEEWNVAEQMRQEGKLRNVALFFKEVDKSKLDDPRPSTPERSRIQSAD